MLRSKLFGILIVYSLYGRHSSAWKLELCIKGSPFILEESACSVGVWFHQPWDISAACVDGGVWAIYKSWCGERPLIWTAHPDKRGCMRKSVLKSVQGLVFLGEESSGAAVSTVRNKLFLSTEYSQSRRGKNSSLSDKEWTVKDRELSVLTWGYDLHALHLLTPSGEEHKCLLKGRHAFAASYLFQPLQREKLTFGLSQEPNCSVKYGHRWSSAKLYPQRLDSQSQLIISSSAEEKEFHCEPQPGNQSIRSKSFKRHIESVNFMSRSRTKDFLTPLDRERIDEQTERLARKLIAHVFLEEPLPDMNFAEWKFLMIAEEIFDAACPQDLVPPDFFENVVVFYRFLLLESFQKFPPNIEKDQDTVSRVETSLLQCLHAAEPFRFKRFNNCSTGLDVLVAEYEHANGTLEDVVVQIPEKIKFNSHVFDALLESVWKLMLFIHYYCADHFTEMPQDLSTLHERWQELMAPDLLTRWQCPGKSYQMMRSLLRMVDLPRVVRHVDHCIAAAHIFSSYTGWVQRPIPPHIIVDGKFYTGIPYGWNEDVNSIFSVKGNNFSFYTSPLGSTIPEVQWDMQTTCLNAFHDPARLLALPMDHCGADVA